MRLGGGVCSGSEGGGSGAGTYKGEEGRLRLAGGGGARESPARTLARGGGAGQDSSREEEGGGATWAAAQLGWAFGPVGRELFLKINSAE